jgi:hypothetical protein
MQICSTFGLLSACQTTLGGAAKSTLPCKSMVAFVF